MRLFFLQGKNPTFSFANLSLWHLHQVPAHVELDWAFGSNGTQDKGKHLATLIS